jgi:UDP-GlcNAc:undecaprenyl-phosphate GlcNAc-1-phosphate transferase
MLALDPIERLLRQGPEEYWAAGGVTLVVSFVAGVVLTELARRAAMRWGFVAAPSADRWHRERAVPLLGGVAVAAAFAATALSLGLLDAPQARILLLAAAAICAVGLLDDRRGLEPTTKLTAQVLAALLLILAGFRLSPTGHAAADLALTVLWLVGITNALNLLDNMNGLCAGVAVLAALFRAALFFYEGEPAGALLCLALAGATLGFLCFNFPAGKVFLGDAGSLFLGFFLAGITLTGSHAYAKNFVALLAFPVLILLVPILDTTLVTITRRLEGRSVVAGGRDHVSHRLVAYGFSDRRAVVLLWALAAASGATALLLAVYGMSRMIGLAALLALSLALLGVYLGRFSQHVHLRFRRTARAGVLVLTALCDLILLASANHLAWLLRFESALVGEPWTLFLRSLPALLLIKFLALILAGAYRRPWKYFGLEDALTLTRASAFASIAAVLYFFLLYRLAGYSRVVLALDFFLTTFLLLGFRASFRILDRLAPREAAAKKRVAIFPAGDAGELALRCILAQRQLCAVGFLDDDGDTRGRRIHAVEVLGGLTEIERLARQHRLDGIVLACEACLSTRRMLEAICRTHGLALLQAGVRIDEVPLASKPDAAEPRAVSPQEIRA